MSVGLGTNIARRRWTWWLCGGALLAVAAAGVTLWRPMTVRDTAIRARLWMGGARSGYVMAGPHRIYYFTAGSGRSVLLLHGLGGDAAQFGDYITVLAKDSRVIAPDLLGFGRSAQPDVEYSTPLQARTVLALLDALQLPRVDIVGLSMGGAIGAEFARLHPDRVRRLVLVDAGGLMANAKWQVPFVPRDSSDVAQLEQMLGPRKPMIPAFVRRDVVRAMRPYGWVVERLVRRRLAGMDLLDGKLAPVTMPVLLVWGSRDVISPLEQAEAFHRQIPQSELLVLRGCGHAALIDCKSAAQPAIRSFLAAATPAAGGRREIDVE